MMEKGSDKNVSKDLNNLIKELKFYIGYDILTTPEDCDEESQVKTKNDRKEVLDTLFEAITPSCDIAERIKAIVEAVNLWGFDKISYASFCRYAGFNTKKEEKIDGVHIREKGKIYDTPFLKLDNYYDNVIRLYETQPFFYDKSKIFWLWNKKQFCWEMVDETDIMIIIDEELGFGGQLVSSGIRTNYLEAFKQVGRKNIPKDAPKTWVQFKNKIFDIETKEVLDASTEYFMCNPIPWEIGTSNDTGTIDKLFNEWVGEKYVDTLYEIIAYCCLADYPIHLMFCLVGCGRNGKSQFQKIIQKFLGVDNISSTELDLLIDNRFESTKLFKKLVCVLGETNFGLMKKTSLLKKLSGGDLIGFEFKNKTPFDAANYAKIIINSNALPSSLDTSDGFYRRWFIINFPNEFPEGKDIVDSIPDIEYINLAKKVTGILPILLENGKLTNQGTIEQRKDAYIMASNPLPFFLSEFCYRDPNICIKSNELYNAYVKYLILSKKRKVSRKEFNGMLAEEGLYSEKNTRNGETGYHIDTIKVKQGWEDLISNTNNTNNTVNLTQKNQYRELSEKHGISGISGISPATENVVENIATEEDILFHINSLGKGEMAIEELLEHFGRDAEEMIEKLKKDGRIFEHKPGWVKKL
jgi:P4 family phage/plasmid primase-like protien